jgi:hypothetical protein
MHGYLKEHIGAFGPHEIRTLVAALDTAWESIQACPSRKSYPHIAMVQSGKNWRGDDRSAPLDSSS